MTSQQKTVCITIIDLHLMFFMHALRAILESDDEGIAELGSTRRGRKKGLEIGNRVAKKEALLENNVIYVLMNA